jgi:hypothetical protein
LAPLKGKVVRLAFGPSSQRIRNTLLIITVVICDGAAMWLSRAPYQGLVAGLTVVGLVTTVVAIMSLLASKGDWPVRVYSLLILVAYTAYKVYSVVDFMRNG